MIAQAMGEVRAASEPAVFLDKDGTLVDDIPFNVDPERIQLADGAPTALRRLHAAGYLLIVVSNQSGVARGYFPERALQGVEARLRGLLESAGVPLAGFYYCPHHPDGLVPCYAVACACRKPAPAMLLRAAREHGIDLSTSWMVGDILDDVEAGRAAGCRTVLLDNGNETEWELTPARLPHYRARGLVEAAGMIIGAAGLARPLSGSIPDQGEEYL
jgi:D-glycero-D-manno-heptose 1,7-bisphosphate phosphatase